MKKCEHIIELISLYIDGELSDAEKHQFEEHINSCIKCKEEFDCQMEIINLCKNIEDVELPEDFNKQLHQKLVKEKQGKGPLFWMNSKYIKLASSIAAAFILIFVTSKFLTIDKFQRGFDMGYNEESHTGENLNLKSFESDMVLNERAVDDEMYDADSEEVNLFSGIENDDGDTQHHKTVGPDISYDDLPTNSSNAADADVKISSGFAGGGMSSNEGDNYLEKESESYGITPSNGSDAASREYTEEIDIGTSPSPEERSLEGVHLLEESEDTIVRVSVINNSLKPEDTAYIIDTVNKLGIEVLEDNTRKDNGLSYENAVLVRLAVKESKYDRFIEELESYFTNIKVNVIADGGTEQIVEVLIE